MISRLLILLIPVFGFGNLTNSPKEYGVMIFPSRVKDSGIMVAFHGMGADNQIGYVLRSYPEIKEEIVTFNFPDHGVISEDANAKYTTFGSFKELVPPLYVLNRLAKDVEAVSIYAFSAGGGAFVNLLAVLNSNQYDHELMQLGIGQKEKDKILDVIENGYVILDSPLKSIEEIIAFRGRSPGLTVLEERYRNNDMVPIESIKKLKGLNLKILIHFQKNDRALSNRDDHLYIQKFKEFNRGFTCGVIGDDGGHISYHKTLWRAYPKFLNHECNYENQD